MLSITRTQSTGSIVTAFRDATVSLRDPNKNSVPDCPDVVFSMKTYEKIAKESEKLDGDHILLAVNLFFNELMEDEQRDIYDMYRFARVVVDRVNKDNLREIQDALQERIFNTLQTLNLPEKLIHFCRHNPRFVYPDLSEVGKMPHHTDAKTFLIDEYIEITAISILSKIMVPIWGEFIARLGDIKIGVNQREKIAFDLIEPSLEEGAFERIYNKLSFSLSSLVKILRAETDKKAMGHTTTSFILTHNGVDDQMFDSIVMATIVVKRMATFECFQRLKDGNTPNAMVYIDDGIKHTTNTRIQNMRDSMNTMPRHEQPSHDDDNISILDYISKTSKKPIDVPVFVTTAVQNWELPRLLQDTDTPKDVFDAAVDYYASNSFDVSPLTQATVASFIGTRFGGSKCIGYLPPNLYQQIVVILQIFLIRQDMIDLAALISAKTVPLPTEGMISPIGLRITANLKSSEYLRCLALFRSFIEKPVKQLGKKVPSRKDEFDKIDFVNHIQKMIEWLIKTGHSENMAPALWEFSHVENRPIVGSDCKFDENIIRNLCRFYLMFHDEKRPF